jgi:hypothetical protein
MKIEKESFDAACVCADVTVKENNGHQFETILKTRCIWCGRSPRARGLCRAWFQTFLFQLSGELTGVYGAPRADACRSEKTNRKSLES